jgi:hypothetical protein
MIWDIAAYNFLTAIHIMKIIMHYHWRHLSLAINLTGISFNNFILILYNILILFFVAFLSLYAAVFIFCHCFYLESQQQDYSTSSLLLSILITPLVRIHLSI